MDQHLFHYRAKIIDVYDGDTVRADIDLGLKTWVKNEKLRLARINTPELRGREREEGMRSRDFLREQILGKEIILETVRDKKGKFGRYIAEIWVKAGGEGFTNINDLLVSEGYARYQEF